MSVASNFRDRLARHDRLLGTFLKTPGIHAAEILAAVGFDFLVVDQEHGPFDTAALDTIALAARAGGVACLVRVADAAPWRLSGMLDMGFAGVIVPHVTSPGEARAVAAACRHKNGTRGFSNSTRAGGYGALSMAEHVDKADRDVTVVAMIEDVHALDDIDGIVSTDGIDAILIGRADLAISLGETSLGAPAVIAAVDRVLAACRRRRVPVFIFTSDVPETTQFAQRGASGFIIGSDQALLRTAALEVHDKFRAQIDS